MSFKYRTKDDDMRELHFKLPKALMYEEKYKKLSANAKLLYAMLNDRTNLSIKNDWYDKFDRAFIICSIEEIEVFLSCARASASKYLKELVDFNLVKKAKASEMEVGKVKNNTMNVENLKESNSNILYVGYVDTTNETLEKHLDSHFENLKQLKQKRKKERKEREQRALFKNCTILENTKIDSNKTLEPSNSKDSTKIELTLVQNLNGSKTDCSKTDSVVVVNKPQYKKIPNRLLTDFETIQLNENLTTNQKILEIQKIKSIGLKEIALLEKFIDAAIFLSDAQLRMFKNFDFRIADNSIDTTIAQGGETFSYFKKVYIAKEKEDIDKMINEVDTYNDIDKLSYDRAIERNWKVSKATYDLAKKYATNNNLFYPSEELINFI